MQDWCKWLFWVKTFFLQQYLNFLERRANKRKKSSLRSLCTLIFCPHFSQKQSANLPKNTGECLNTKLKSTCKNSGRKCFFLPDALVKEAEERISLALNGRPGYESGCQFVSDMLSQFFFCGRQKYIQCVRKRISPEKVTYVSLAQSHSIMF